MLDGRGAGVFKAGHHSDWTVCFHLIGEGDGKAEASVPAVPSTWPRSGWNGSADDQCLQRCTHNHLQHMHLDYLWQKQKVNAKFCHETLDGTDGSLTQIDDIHSVKLLGTSWLVHVIYTANELTALHLNGWLAFTRAVRSALSEILWNPSPSPAPPV